MCYALTHPQVGTTHQFAPCSAQTDVSDAWRHLPSKASLKRSLLAKAREQEAGGLAVSKTIRRPEEATAPRSAKEHETSILADIILCFVDNQTPQPHAS